MGEMGRLGYLMTREFGPRQRLSAVTTDLPLVPDEPVDIGVEDFCRICRKCAVCCPSRSIPEGDPQEVNGSLRWKLNEMTCFEYWGKVGTDCNVCMRVCPWSHARTLPHRMIVWMVPGTVRPGDCSRGWTTSSTERDRDPRTLPPGPASGDERYRGKARSSSFGPPKAAPDRDRQDESSMRARGNRSSRALVGLLLVLGALAYRHLLFWDPSQPGLPGTGWFFFRVSETAPQILFVLAVPLFYRRRKRIARALRGEPAPRLALPFLALGVALFRMGALRRRSRPGPGLAPGGHPRLGFSSLGPTPRP